MAVIMFSGLFAIWAVYISNVCTYAFLLLHYSVNILMPFQTFIMVGIGFLLIRSIANCLSEEKGSLPFFVNVILGILTIISLGFTVPSIFTIHSDIQLSFDLSVSFGCIVGIMISFVALLALTNDAINH
jgi:hypothetical protein